MHTGGDTHIDYGLRPAQAAAAIGVALVITTARRMWRGGQRGASGRGADEQDSSEGEESSLVGQQRPSRRASRQVRVKPVKKQHGAANRPLTPAELAALVDDRDRRHRDIKC